MIVKHLFIAGCAFVVAAIGFTGTTSAESGKPNILLILADDAGYGDLGFTGSKEIKTPVLDQLASNGVVWNDWNANNMENVLLHAYDYQEYRHKMYEELFRRQEDAAANRKPVVIE